jgi:hypothetical protein
MRMSHARALGGPRPPATVPGSARQIYRVILTYVARARLARAAEAHVLLPRAGSSEAQVVMRRRLGLATGVARPATVVYIIIFADVTYIKGYDARANE